MLLFAAFILLLPASSAKAQEIRFSDYHAYSIELDDLTPAQDLDFGMIFSGEGHKALNIAHAKVLSITGVKYLDVLVDITAENYLLLDGEPLNANQTNKRIPFTLQAAYANRGTDNPGIATPIQTVSNMASARFRIRGRDNGPPGPPPVPVHGTYNPALYNDTAYLYLFGSINVGAVNAGPYASKIIITLSYD